MMEPNEKDKVIDVNASICLGRITAGVLELGRLVEESNEHLMAERVSHQKTKKHLATANEAMAAAGVQIDPSAATPMLGAAQAIAVKQFGNPGHQAAYLRLRGWKQHAAGGPVRWASPYMENGNFVLESAFKQQFDRDIEPMKKLLSGMVQESINQMATPRATPVAETAEV